MPWHVDKSDQCPPSKPWAVVKDADGSVVACHETEADANAQVAALYASEDMEANHAEVTFDDPDIAASFRVDPEKRVITGLVVPWNATSQQVDYAYWRFMPDSLQWSDVSRIKLNLNHERHDLIGRATRLQSGSNGLTATFKVADTPEGQRALALAKDQIIDGFSIEVDWDDWQQDPSDPSVRLVKQATLRGVALTGTPAFDDARVTAVAASRDKPQKGNSMTAKVEESKPDASFDFDGYMKDLGAKMVESQKGLTEQFASTFGDALTAGIKTALEGMPSPQSGPESVKAARFAVTYEPPVYAFAGTGHSLVRDAYHAYHQRDRDAADRLRKYEQQTEEMAKLAVASLETARFTPQSTSTASQIIPPGYRPDLYVSELLRGRPLVNGCARGSIDNATPFVIPVFTSSTSVTADHVEGTNPADGSVAFSTKTVTPGGISGRLTLTREIVDSSNPAIDQIALATMRESYARQTETKVYTLLNGANGAGGTITTGFVPSGAQAATFVGTTGTPPALIGGIRSRLAAYPFNRFASPSAALMGQNATTILATAADTTGRPVFPSVGAQNTSGLGNAMSQGWNVDGLAFIPAWAMTGVAAGDTQIAIFNSADFWVWESPLLSFRYEEKQGPANIELNVFGYFATALIRPVGLSGIRIT